MVGLFNTVGHETESETNAAATRLFNALAVVHDMLAGVESGDVTSADDHRERAINEFLQVAPAYESMASFANENQIFVLIEGKTSSAELSELHGLLVRYGISASLRNRDLFGIAAKEVRGVVEVLGRVSFAGRHADWYAVREVVEQVNRLTTLGVAFSRLASLTGNDPQLRN